jgi:hypothetical protein
MSQSLLIVGFLDRSGLNIQVHADTVSRILISHEHKPESILESAEKHFRIRFKITPLMGPKGACFGGAGVRNCNTLRNRNKRCLISVNWIQNQK